MSNFLEEKVDRVFITKANYQRMFKKFDLKNIPDLQGDIYKRPIYFFSKFEQKDLLAMKALLKDPENFIGLYYNPVVREDTLRYVYENGQPAYHRHSECPNLHSQFKNFEIPIEIREKGKEEVTRFRNWFKANKELFETDIKRFTELLELYFLVKVSPKTIEQGNSGSQQVINYSLEELENEIDALVKEAGRFYYASEKNTVILKRFSKFTFLAYKADPIDGNETGYSQAEVKELLRHYNETFKKPIKRLLVEYYKVTYNPSLSFSGALLDMLGFKCCGSCENGLLIEEIEKLNSNTDDPINLDDLPF
jgi:hypothetical protein